MVSLFLTTWTSWPTSIWLSIVFFGLLIGYIYEQIVYLSKRGSLPEPKLTVPFLGGTIHMIMAPYDFWHGQMEYGKLSWNPIIGRFFVLITDSEYRRKIFEKCSSDMPLVSQ